MSELRTRYPGVTEQLIPFVVSAPGNLEAMDLAPFGLAVEQTVDPLRMGSRRFIERIQTIDRLAFGPRGLHMPQWIFFDGAAVTGAMFGFCIPVSRLERSEREALELDIDEPGLVPLSIYAAIPTHRPGLWMGHNLSSLGRRLPRRPLRGLGLLTKALALRAFRARWQCGVTQWGAGALNLHCRFGPLELMSAYTPAHTRADSITYVWEITEERLRAAMGDPEARIARPGPHAWIAGGDHEAMIRLQREIEAGRRMLIPAPPEPPAHEGGRSRIPVHYVE